MTKLILALDPGTEQTGYVVFNGNRVWECGILPNEEMRKKVYEWRGADEMAIELIEARGMPVGKETFETCYWVGRFIEIWEEDSAGKPLRRIYRRQVKSHLCGSMKAKDSNIRQALIDKYGEPGSKAKPGILYGIKSHIWSALAVAVTAMELPA